MSSLSLPTLYPPMSSLESSYLKLKMPLTSEEESVVSDSASLTAPTSERSWKTTPRTRGRHVALSISDVRRAATAKSEKEGLNQVHEDVELQQQQPEPSCVDSLIVEMQKFVVVEKADELFKPLREQGNSYTKICLSNRSFGLDAANVAVPILSSMKHQLKEVDLSDFIAGRPEAEAIEVMTLFSSTLEGCVLRYLNLSDNAMGEKGVNAFETLLRSQSNLEELYLMHDGISEEAARAVCKFIPSTENLKVLHFHNNMTGDEGALAISDIVKRSLVLEDFRCSSTRVGSEGGVALAEALGTCTHLRKLDLRDNMFGVESGVAWSKAVSAFTGLTEIYFSYLNLEDEGTEALVNALKEFAPSLEVLELAGNDITVKSTAALASCIATKEFLTKLVLSENEMKDEGAILISKALAEGHAQLIEVDLSSNAIRRAGARLLAQAVVNKPRFKLLNINGNFISDEGIDEVGVETPGKENGKEVSLIISSLECGFLDLIKDPNGNHVIQRCLDCFSIKQNAFIFDAAARFCVEIATQRHGCCVLQKCISHATGKHREKLLTEVSWNGLFLSQDPFGNYVVQYVIELKIPYVMAGLITQLKGHCIPLSMQKFSSHVVEKCLIHYEESRVKIIQEFLSISHLEKLLQDPYANYVIQCATVEHC